MGIVSQNVTYRISGMIFESQDGYIEEDVEAEMVVRLMQTTGDARQSADQTKHLGLPVPQDRPQPL